MLVSAIERRRTYSALSESERRHRLLFERNLADQFDRIVLVDAPRPLRLERLVKDRGLSETEAMDMIAAQMPAELKRALVPVQVESWRETAWLHPEAAMPRRVNAPVTSPSNSTPPR